MEHSQIDTEILKGKVIAEVELNTYGEIAIFFFTDGTKFEVSFWAEHADNTGMDIEYEDGKS